MLEFICLFLFIFLMYLLYNRRINNFNFLMKSKRVDEYKEYLSSLSEKYGFKEKVNVILSNHENSSVYFKKENFIILNKKTLCKISKEETYSLLCHEFSHILNEDVKKQITFIKFSIISRSIILASAIHLLFFYKNWNDYLVFLLSLFVFISLCLSYINKKKQSIWEIKADLFSIRENSPENFISLIKKVCPPFEHCFDQYMRGPHLPTRDRIKLAEKYIKS